MSFKYEIGNGQVTIKFPGKPAANIRSALKAGGFRWSPSGGYWWRRKVTGAADYIDALRRMLEGPTAAPQHPCWTCKQPGIMRSYGASTPVLCVDCWENFLDVNDPTRATYRGPHQGHAPDIDIANGY